MEARRALKACLHLSYCTRGSWRQHEVMVAIACTFRSRGPGGTNRAVRRGQIASVYQHTEVRWHVHMYSNLLDQERLLTGTRKLKNWFATVQYARGGNHDIYHEARPSFDFSVQIVNIRTRQSCRKLIEQRIASPGCSGLFIQKIPFE